MSGPCPTTSMHAPAGRDEPALGVGGHPGAQDRGAVDGGRRLEALDGVAGARGRPGSPRRRPPRGRPRRRRRSRRRSSSPAAAEASSAARSDVRRSSTTWLSGSPKRMLYSTSFGPVGREHQPGVEHAAVVDAPPAQLGEGRLDEAGEDVVDEPGRQPRQRRVGAHAAGVGAGVAVADALEVLGRGEERRPAARRTPRTRTPRGRPCPPRSRPCGPASPNEAPESLSRTSASASARSSVTSTPLPGGEPVGLHHVGPGEGAEELERPARRRRSARSGPWARPPR